MTERREIKQRSPAVWAKVREAYLAGEPAASVARRFDVGLGNLRFRANAEGWTRKAAMAAAETEAAAEDIRLAGRADPVLPAAEAPIDIDPEEARAAGIRHAAALIAAGRGAEALSLLKAVQGLAETLETTASCDEEPEPDAFDFRALETHSLEMAVKNAEAMLGDTGYGITSAFGHAAYHWRAANLGPEIALADFAAGVNGGWAGRYWDAVGNLKPLAGEVPEPGGAMVRQHLRLTPDADMEAWPWNRERPAEPDVRAEDDGPARGPRVRLG
ncbi:hypothetical protein [Brevundimonas sp.]|uniref:hypothetical protein n=1 Tax=Brevundimonas sp. TaxID=1871086 RepID=UPI003D1166F6